MSLTNNITLRIVSTAKDESGATVKSSEFSRNIITALNTSDTQYAVNGETPADPFANVYDLADESLSNPLGVAVELGTVEMIYFKNTSENPLTLGGGADDIAALAGGILVPPVSESNPNGGVVFMLGRYAVEADADQITVTGTEAGDTYELLIIGTTPAPEPEP